MVNNSHVVKVKATVYTRYIENYIENCQGNKVKAL